MCNGVIRRPPLSQATARQALYPLPISPVLPVPDAGEIFHLLRVQLTDVGRVDDDQRVLMDVTRAQTGDSVGNPLLDALAPEHPAQPVLQFLHRYRLVERAGDPAELHVLRRLYPVDHVAHELAERLGKPGGKFPQKILELLSRFERRCAMIHVGFPFRFLVEPPFWQNRRRKTTFSLSGTPVRDASPLFSRT
jgi:hypothetical protein